MTGCGKTTQPANFVFEQAENAIVNEQSAIQLESGDKAVQALEESLEIQKIEQEIDLPATFDNDVDFVSQAPFANWDLPYQEACEEASIITVYYYFTQQDLTPEKMDEEIKKLVDWEKENLGTYTDTSVAEVAQIVEDYFNLQVQIIENVTVENIKTELVKGNLIVAPFAGRLLENPNFTEPGPLYHMLVIRGYDRNEFITNDVGTRKGEAYKYKYDVLLSAMHDLPIVDNDIFRPYERTDYSDEQKAQLMTQGNQVFLSIKIK